MLKVRLLTTAVLLLVTSAALAVPAAARRKRFDNVSVEAVSGGGRCTQADLIVTTAGLETRGCHETDVRAAWKAVESVCYAYGFRPTLVVRSNGSERRIFVTTPAELKEVQAAVRSRAPKVAERTDCK